jgi:hypothetical protein
MFPNDTREHKDSELNDSRLQFSLHFFANKICIYRSRSQIFQLCQIFDKNYWLPSYDYALDSGDET